MKKKIFGGVAVLAIAAMAAFNLNLNTEGSDMSLLSLANVEALAQAENNTSVNIPCCSMTDSKCYVSIVDGNGNKGTMDILPKSSRCILSLTAVSLNWQS